MTDTAAETITDVEVLPPPFGVSASIFSLTGEITALARSTARLEAGSVVSVWTASARENLAAIRREVAMIEAALAASFPGA